MVRRFTAILLMLAMAGLAFGQFGQGKKKETATRSVSGVVTNGSGEPVAGAIVQLKNTKNLQVRSFITKDKGDYYFYELATDVDYEFKAEWNGKSSKTRTLSSFDTHPTVVINLELK